MPLRWFREEVEERAVVPEVVAARRQGNGGYISGDPGNGISPMAEALANFGKRRFGNIERREVRVAAGQQVVYQGGAPRAYVKNGGGPGEAGFLDPANRMLEMRRVPTGLGGRPGLEGMLPVAFQVHTQLYRVACPGCDGATMLGSL